VSELYPESKFESSKSSSWLRTCKCTKVGLVMEAGLFSAPVVNIECQSGKLVLESRFSLLVLGCGLMMTGLVFRHVIMLLLTLSPPFEGLTSRIGDL
jgi:hypothetical protein